MKTTRLHYRSRATTYARVVQKRRTNRAKVARENLLILSTFAITAFTILGLFFKAESAIKNASVPIVNAMPSTIPTIFPSPKTVVALSSATPTPTPLPTPLGKATEDKKREMVELVKEVFKEYSDKALKLLNCENRSLDSEVVNTNKDNLHTQDFGLFQINSYWQGVRHIGKAKQFLLDPEINARIAYRIFEDDGYSFKQWTCGKKLGI